MPTNVDWGLETMSAPFQQQSQQHGKLGIFGHAMLAGAGVWATYKLAPAIVDTSYGAVPLIIEAQMLHPWPTLAAAFAATHLVMLSGRVCERMAGWLEYRASLIPLEYKASARFATWKDIKGSCFKYGWSAYFGTYAGQEKRHRGKPIFTNYTTTFLCFGNSGTGKGVGSVVPNIMALANAGHSMLINDFKPNLAAMTKPYLESRGYIVHVVNLGNLQTDILGKTASYNLYKIVINGFLHGTLADVVNDISELMLQLYPESSASGGSNDNEFWRDGSREIMEVSSLMVILVHGEAATLSHARLLILDRDALLKDMLWAAGDAVDSNGHPIAPMPLEQHPLLHHHPKAERVAFIKEFRTRCGEIAKQLASQDKSNMAQSFLKGAYGALKPFSMVSTSFAALSQSTFSFGDMKDRNGGKPVAVIIAMDSSRMGQGQRLVSALQSAAQTEWKRHPNKHVPVYWIGDEATNGKIYKLPEFLTWAREFSVHISLYVQSISAFRDVYGKDSVGTLLGQAEILQFLPQQRDPEMLELIEKLLGSRAYVSQNRNAAFHGFNMQGQTLNEETRPLLTQDEIRRCTKAITFIRNNRPVLTDLPSYAAIHPWRHQVANNPFYTKRYRKRIRLRLGKRRAPWRVQFYYGVISILTWGRK